MTTRVGEHALCVLYTQGLHAPKLFFSMDLIRGVTHVLKVIVCVYQRRSGSIKDEQLLVKVVEAHSSATWLARFCFVAWCCECLGTYTGSAAACVTRLKG